MANDVRVNITAKDGASQTFVAIGRNAELMGNKVDAAGTKSSKSMKAWTDAAQAAGLALGTVALVSSRVAAEAEASNARLATSFTNAGMAVEDYQMQLDRLRDTGLSLAFDDEDVQDSIAALVDVTQDAESAFEGLAIAQDIARARQISLADATRIVIAAETGRYQSLLRMGIAVDATMSKEEVLASLQSRYAGQAEAYADTTAASYDRIANTIENTLESVGSFTNDYAGVIIALSATATAAGPAIDAFRAVGTAARGSAVGSALLGSAWLGPAGLAVAGLGVVAMLGRMVNANEDTVASQELAEQAAVTLANTYTALAASIDNVTLRQGLQTQFQQFDALNKEGQKNVQVLNAVTTAMQQLKAVYTGDNDAELIPISMLEGLNEVDQAWLESSFGNGNAFLSLNELTAIQTAYASSLQLTQKEVQAINQDLKDLYSHANEEGFDLGAAMGATQEVFDMLDQNLITGDQAVQMIDEIATGWSNYSAFALDAAESTAFLTQSITAQTTAMAISEDQWLQTRTAAIGYAVGLGEASGATVQAGQDMGWLREQIEALGESLRDTTPADTLDRVYRAIVGNTNAMVGSIDTARKWADELIAPVGTYAAVDDLLRAGKISIEEYNAAQQAQIDITEDYNRALEASQVIQAKQAPLIAEQTDATADYLDGLSLLTAQEQQVALAWADTDYAKRATDIVNMAASYDTMTDAQKRSFDDLITNAAAADPVLASVLEDLGLITSTDGEIKINYDALGGANDATADLTDAINNLADLLAQIYDIQINYSTASEASGLLGTLAAQMAALDGSSATVYINGVQTGFVQPEYATGGMVNVRLAELGPERLRFANGGTAIAPFDGNYLIPNGTNVQTAAATRATSGGQGGGNTFHFSGGLTLVPPTPDMHNQALGNLIMQGVN